MLKLGIVTSLVALALAPVAVAAPNENANERATVKVCKNLKAQMGAGAFNAVMAPVTRNPRAALRNCAKREAAAMQAARQNAAQTCKTERGTTPASQAAFRAKYGGGKNAFGKCVSMTARAQNQARRAALVNASQTCKTERGTTDASRAAFVAKYGGGRNAFGKCVSTAAKAQNA
jgi:hypothetical protein